MNAPLPSHHFAATCAQGARFRMADEITLDLFHRDARVDDRWLGLGADEFAMLWRLAASPGERLTRDELLAETWQFAGADENDDAAPGLAGLHAKLAAAGTAYLICTDGAQRVFLAARPSAALMQAGTRP